MAELGLIPSWARELSRLYWRLRACRGLSRPGRRTWWRRIAAEKQRQLAEGVPAIELHLVCRVLANPHNPASERRWVQYLERKRAGVSPWASVPAKVP